MQKIWGFYYFYLWYFYWNSGIIVSVLTSSSSSWVHSSVACMSWVWQFMGLLLGHVHVSSVAVHGFTTWSRACLECSSSWVHYLGHVHVLSVAVHGSTTWVTCMSWVWQFMGSLLGCVHVLNVAVHGFTPWSCACLEYGSSWIISRSGQTKDYKIGICLLLR
jgi:hypothetical protein